MNKIKKYYITLFFLFVFCVGAFVHVKTLPPLYFFSKVKFKIHGSALSDFGDFFKKNENLTSIFINVNGKLDINRGQGIGLSEKEAGEILRLMEGASVDPVWKVGNDIMFYIGSGEKFGKLFQVSFVLKERSYDVDECRNQYINEKLGNCVLSLGNGWYLQYDWVNLPGL